MFDETVVSGTAKNNGDLQKEEMEESGASFEQQLSEQNMPSLQKGMLVRAKVVQINTDAVLFDVGWKTEGYMSLADLVDELGKALHVEVGDEVDVNVEGRDSDGTFVLSRKQILKNKLWETIVKAQETGEPITGILSERVKGGFMVNIGGIPAFLPGSQAGGELLNDFEGSRGRSYSFEVVKYEKKRSNVVLSQKGMLAKEEKARREGVLEQIKVGDVVEGVVKNVIEYGAFIDIGGVDGLLHMGDIAWGKMVKPSDCYSKGDKVSVKIILVDKERGKVLLGVKQLSVDPWEGIVEKYTIGEIVKGRVVSTANYGFFVELPTGVVGLVHRSEVSWGKSLQNPQKVVKVGDEVSVAVVGIDDVARKISLSWKRAKENPWEVAKHKYPEGTVITGTVRSLTVFGAFIGLEEGIDGLVHVSDMSWRKHVNHPSEVLKKGDTVTAIVLGVDPEVEKISLGIKQLEDNPWETFDRRYPIGTSLTGKVASIADFGAFVKIEEGVEGLLHLSELATNQKQKTVPFSVGDEITVTIKGVDTKSKRIKLTMKPLEIESPQPDTDTAAYNPPKDVASRMGEALANAIQQKGGIKK
ncbi:MAG: 30S ribosomal protein S1 [Deltaproteobacteria bacterium]|nr:30S ribosomal protein S1 [Deltaproteobacteria bacterium]